MANPADEELFDVYTAEGEPWGTPVPRSLAHREGLWHRSAHLWLVDPTLTKVLLQQRHPSKQSDPGRWDIAVAGHLSAGQTPLEAVVREAYEELGLLLSPADLSELTVTRKQYLEPGFIDREWQHVFGGVWGGALEQLVLQADEVVAVRWMDLDAFREAVERGDDAYVGRRGDWAPFEAWLRAL